MKLSISRIIYISAILLLSACTHVQHNGNGEAKMGNDIEIILSKILRHPDFEKYIHPEENGRLPIKIVTTEEIGTHLSLSQYGEKVIFLESISEAGNSPSIQIESFEIEKNKANFSILYPIEGIRIKGVAELNNNNWIFSDFRIIER